MKQIIEVEHHIKYKEIHGIDETVWMEKGKHLALHTRLRKEKKCNIPIETLRKISAAAGQRTQKGKEYLHKYRRTLKAKEKRKEYEKQSLQRIQFYENLGENVRLQDVLCFNTHTGNVTWTASFQAYNGKLLCESPQGGELCAK